MRRAASALALLSVAACAQVEPPSGGPEDKVAPRVLTTRPDTNAVVGRFSAPVTVVFDERVSETGIEEAVSVSPRTSAVRVDHSGDQIQVSLVRGWEPGRIYQVRVERGLRDLFGNQTTEPVEIVFSTGPAIPDTRLTGTVVSRTTGERQRDTRVEAVLAPDSLVYSVRTDSAGGFTFTRIPAGTYRIRAFSDVNRNRALDVFEARDTTRVQLAQTAGPLFLRTLAPDTTAPRAGAAEAEGDVVRVVFDDFLDPAQTVRPAQVRIVGPDSALVPVAEVRVGLFARPVADSAAAEGDTTGRAARPRPLGTPAPARPGATTPAAGAAATVAADTLPSRTLSIRVAAPLRPRSEYRIVITGVRNIVGLTGGGESPLRTPAPAAPAAPAGPRPAPGDTTAPRPAPASPAPPTGTTNPTPRGRR